MTAPVKRTQPEGGEIWHVYRRPTEVGEPSALAELTRVVVLVPVETLEGDKVDAGTEGVIVGVWRNGAAYEVEFRDALGPASVDAAHVQAIAE